MRKNIIFLGMLSFCLFISTQLHSQSVDVNIGTESANFECFSIIY